MLKKYQKPVIIIKRSNITLNKRNAGLGLWKKFSDT